MTITGHPFRHVILPRSFAWCVKRSPCRPP
jgi:hypothetical protein